jgi:hypothetical protein
MAFGFRIWFFAPPGTDAGTQATLIPVPDCPDPIRLFQQPPVPNGLPTDRVAFSVHANDFHDQATAADVGSRVRSALGIYSAKERLGFDLGKDIETASWSAGMRNAAEESGEQLLPTVHGLQVFETTLQPRWLRVDLRLSAPRKVNGLAEGVAAEYPARRLSDKTALALHLYNCSRNESDPRTRFLSLITVIEVLADPGPRDLATAQFLDRCIEETKCLQLDEKARDSLRMGLGNLKREAIGTACAQLVSRAGGDAKFLRNCYKARSELVHTGTSKTFPKIPQEIDPVDQLVRGVVLHAVESEAKASP